MNSPVTLQASLSESPISSDRNMDLRNTALVFNDFSYKGDLTKAMLPSHSSAITSTLKTDYLLVSIRNQ
jgi:hypothetical protein